MRIIQLRCAILLAVLMVVGAVLSQSLWADEGMWTFDNFPSKMVGAKYGFTPSQAWLDHVRLSSLRIAGGCSASFISPNGLVMTNHHCVIECVEELSSPKENLSENGFAAKTAAEERKCPAFELDQLVEIRDVTADMQSATAGRTGDAANKAMRAKEAELQQGCGHDPGVRCDVISLYHGGIYDLYRYKRYTDVRLVFAPEFGVAQFGGDPDNFNFPRFDFDIGVVRAYENGKPASTPDYFRWSADGSRDGELVFVAGNPGGTSRELTMSQLDYLRGTSLPLVLNEYSEYRGLLEEFSARGVEQERQAKESLFIIENSYKAIFGRQAALLDPQFMAVKAQKEQKLRAAVAADPNLSAYGSAWDEIAEVQKVRTHLFHRASIVNSRFLRDGLMEYAVMLVRSAAERAKPNADRLPEYRDQALVHVQDVISSPVPVYKDLEELNIAFFLTLVRRDIGTDDPFVKKVLGQESPEELAHHLVTGTHLDDAKVREQLYNGGAGAIAASDDPLIKFIASINDDLLAVRKDYETRVDAPTRTAAEKIAKARFAIYGTTVDPDATFTPRLSYGTVKGFEDEEGKFVTPYTTIGGLFERATGAPPYKLPSTWLNAKPSLNLSTQMNLSTTNDIIGGNSGSPLFNKDAQIVGLIFDGNIFSLGGDYGYDAKQNRAVAVDSRALLEAMKKVYHLDRVVEEIEAGRK